MMSWRFRLVVPAWAKIAITSRQCLATAHKSLGTSAIAVWRSNGAVVARTFCGNPGVAAGLQLHVSALDGKPTGLDAALRVIREIQPKQVMIETCDQRFALAQRSAKLATNTAVGRPSGDGSMAETPSTHSQTDVINVVFGGIRSNDVVALVGAVDEIGAPVYMIDRSYQETQNRVARQLALHPSELLAFVRYMTAKFSGDQTLGDLKDKCPGVHKIVATQRELHMANEIVRRAVPGVDVLLICTDERAAALHHLLYDSATLPDLHLLTKQRASRIWPFALILGYLLLPSYGLLFISWRCASWLAATLGALMTGPKDIGAERGYDQVETMQSMNSASVVNSTVQTTHGVDKGPARD